MTRAGAILLLALSLVGAGEARAGERGRRQLYAQQADVLVERPGLARLALPADVLAQCRPDGADLLILDLDGVEVPYAFDSGVDLDQVREVIETAPAEILESVRGEASDLEGERFFLERYEIVRPPASSGATQLLLVEAGRSGSVEVEGGYARRADRVWTQAPIDLASAVRDGWGHEIELPEGLGERITVTLRDRDPRAAPPVILFRSVRVQAQERVRVRLDTVSWRDDAGTTWVDLARPPGWRIDALEIETSTTAFSRRVSIYDVPAHGGAVEVGRTLLARVGDAPAQAHSISLRPLRGERLRVAIRNADSPSLADLRFFAIVRRPALVFPVHAVRDGRVGTLLFGGSRVRRPHYDLQDIVNGADSSARAEIFAGGRVATARLAEVRANPDYDAQPLLHFAMQPGAHIDVNEYRYRRPLRVTSAVDGLSLLQLGADDLARTRDDLADLRVVDTEGRQWPYLLRRGDDVGWADGEWRRGEAEPGQTRLRIELATAPRALPIDRLSLHVANVYFQRPFELIGYDRAGQARTLVRSTLRNEIDESGPVDIAFAEFRAVRLELIIEDGDDAPLRVEAARVRYASPTVFLVAPAGSYQMLLGNPEASPPQYELAAIRDVVYSLAGEEADAGTLAANADYVAPAQRRRGARWWRNAQLLVVWGSLIGAVLVLAVLTLRQVRDEPGAPPPD